MSGFIVYEFDDTRGHVMTNKIPKTLDTNFEDVKHHAMPNTTGVRIADDVFYFFRTRKDKKFHNISVMFRCSRDKRKSRGCSQCSIVMVSTFSFFGLFRKIIETIGPAFFQHGIKVLEMAYDSILSWPNLLESLSSTTMLDLPLFGTILKFSISRSLLTHENKIDDVPLYCLVGDTYLMWNLWEIMITGEPLLVYGESPEQCSRIVLSIVSLISPLVSACDFRPYLSIHTKVADTIIEAHDKGSILPVVAGVTNQLWLKSLSRWPNVLILGQSKVLAKEKCQSNVRVISNDAPLLKHIALEKKKIRNTLIRRKKACISSRRDVLDSLLRPKSVFMNASGFVTANGDIEIANTKILRTHFKTLTMNFTKPFEKYFSADIPTFRSSSFLKKDLSSKPNSEFEKIMCNSKSSWMELYKRFLIGRTFKMWFLNRRKRIVVESVSTGEGASDKIRFNQTQSSSTTGGRNRYQSF